MKTICVYAASSDLIDRAFVDDAARIGAGMAQRNWSLVYGGGSVGLMGAVARAIHANHGHVIGVIPEKLKNMEVAYEDADEFIVTETMRERKAIMEERADAFIVLPGGFGTLEEVLEILTLKQLGYHQKPLVLPNTAGIYDGLVRFFNGLVQANFIKDAHNELYHVADTPEDVFSYIERYAPSPLEDKF